MFQHRAVCTPHLHQTTTTDGDCLKNRQGEPVQASSMLCRTSECTLQCLWLSATQEQGGRHSSWGRVQVTPGRATLCCVAQNLINQTPHQKSSMCLLTPHQVGCSKHVNACSVEQPTTVTVGCAERGGPLREPAGHKVLLGV